MRGLLQASLLLAPALALPFVVPRAAEDVEGDQVISDYSSALISVDIPSPSPNEWAQALAFRLKVFPSEEACGFGHVTVDGQALPQTWDGNVATGKGSIVTDSRDAIDASWSFTCIKANGQPDSQILKLIVDSVNGSVSEDVRFSAWFRQTGTPETHEIDLTILHNVVATPNPEGLHTFHTFGNEDQDFSEFSVEQEMDELRWLRAQMRELEYLIWTKEQAVAEHASTPSEGEIKDCDSLKCLAKGVIDKARTVAYKAFNKIHSHNGEHVHHDLEEEIGHFPTKHSKHRNHTRGSPKHGHHAAPPHWKPKKPHRTPLPICRYPPPSRKGGSDHRPPHHPPPPHGQGSRQPPKHGDMPHLPPRHHGDLSHDEPPKGRPGWSDHKMGQPHEGHRGPPLDGKGSLHAAPCGPPHKDHHSLPCFEAPFQPFFNEPGLPGPRHNILIKAFHIIKFVTIGLLLSLFIITLHSLGCSPKKRADRDARREERQRRRALRRAARKDAIARFFARLSGRHETANESEDYEEKRRALLASAAEDGLSTTMTEEISEFRNAADVVDEMVSTESSRSRSQAQPIPIPIATPASSDCPPVLRDFDLNSQVVGVGEELPAYEDNDGSEMSSVVADGFMYTPGSTEYSPSDSPTPAGSVSDILGPDTKK